MEASSAIFWVFGITQPGIEPRSPRPLANTPRPLANTLNTMPMSSLLTLLHTYTTPKTHTNAYPTHVHHILIYTLQSYAQTHKHLHSYLTYTQYIHTNTHPSYSQIETDTHRNTNSYTFMYHILTHAPHTQHIHDYTCTHT